MYFKKNRIEIDVAWAFSGAAARAVAHFRNAEVAMRLGNKPNVIIGNSSGAIIAPIIAVAYEDPQLMIDGIKFAETLDTADMFPHKGNKPFTKKGKVAPGAVLRAMSHNHLGWQDIKPMYKKVFTEKHFQMLKKSPIKCIAFGVIGEDWSPVEYVLNDAETLDEMIDMIETSSRIVPFTQPMVYKGKGHVDGGFLAFNPGWRLFANYKMEELITFYSRETKEAMSKNSKWDKNILSVTTQAMNGMAFWHGNKDAMLEEAYSALDSVKYMRIEAPDGYTDEVYETDDHQLIALGEASAEISERMWNLYNQ